MVPTVKEQAYFSFLNPQVQGLHSFHFLQTITSLLSTYYTQLKIHLFITSNATVRPQPPQERGLCLTLLLVHSTVPVLSPL